MRLFPKTVRPRARARVMFGFYMLAAGAAAWLTIYGACCAEWGYLGLGVMWFCGAMLLAACEAVEL